MRSTCAVSSASRRAARTTASPRAAICAASAAPIPELAPVITMTFDAVVVFMDDILLSYLSSDVSSLLLIPLLQNIVPFELQCSLFCEVTFGGERRICVEAGVD